MKDYPYGFGSRFEGKPGSNPEELIGAAHAACFTMALSLILGEAKLTARAMETKADVTLEKAGRRLLHHLGTPSTDGENPGRRQGEIRGTGRHGKGRVSDLKAVQYQNHA